jgi:hypothetical protein
MGHGLLTGRGSAQEQDRSSPHPYGIYGAVRPGRMLDSTALGS